MPKRSSSNTTAKASNKKAKADAPADVTTNPTTTISQWRVVLTGDFTDKTLLEATLKERGAAVTSAVSGKTTHLILGTSGVNEYGKKTGVGSSKHQAAVEKNLPILSERHVLGILQGTLTEASLAQAKENAKISATKSSPLSVKVLFCIQETGLDKVSLARLKKELSDRFGIDTGSTRNKNSLKKALDTLVQEEKVIKQGASYKLPDVMAAAELPTCVADLPTTESAQKESTQSKINKQCPKTGRWRGLRVVSRKKSKSGRAKCKACNSAIAKGETQVEVCDDSLFKMLVFPGDAHEGVTRGYVECGYPGYEVISRKTFYVHEGCLEDAGETFRDAFDRDWAKVRPHVLNDLFPDQDEYDDDDDGDDD